MNNALRAVAVPCGLVITAWLLTWSPPFHVTGSNGLFIAAVAISAYVHGRKSGLLALVLSLVTIVILMDKLIFLGHPMMYFSFTFASLTIIWLEGKLRDSRLALVALQQQERATIATRLSELVHQTGDALAVLSAEVQLLVAEASWSALETHLAKVTGKLTGIRKELEKL